MDHPARKEMPYLSKDNESCPAETASRIPRLVAIKTVPDGAVREMLLMRSAFEA